MKMIWGTDERAQRDRDVTDRQLAEAERKVEQLHETLDRPHRNLDEAIYAITHQRRE